VQTDIKAATAFLVLLTGSLALASGSPQDADYEAGYELGKQLGGPEGRQRVDPDAVYRGLVDGLEAARSGTDKRKHLRGRTGALADDFALLNSQRPGVTTLASGVQYEVLREGSGPVATAQDSVALHYEGSLSTGYVFDSTVSQDEPITLKVSDVVVPGFREALLLMPAGSHWRIVVPASQGFARAGNNKLRRRDLIFDVRLLEVLP
jgi:FKBP-type peptidyl-prolyl cis-trans isomerase